jgi:hypothetical protein
MNYLQEICRLLKKEIHYFHLEFSFCIFFFFDDNWKLLLLIKRAFCFIQKALEIITRFWKLFNFCCVFILLFSTYVPQRRSYNQSKNSFWSRLSDYKFFLPQEIKIKWKKNIFYLCRKIHEKVKEKMEKKN